jgi:hypothetical protein
MSIDPVGGEHLAEHRLNVVFLADVAEDGDRLAAAGRDVGDDLIRLFLGGDVVHDHLGPAAARALATAAPMPLLAPVTSSLSDLN